MEPAADDPELPADDREPAADDADSTAGDTERTAGETERAPADPEERGSNPSEQHPPADGEPPGSGDAESAATDEWSAPTNPGGVELPADVPEDVQAYERFTKMDRADYDRVNEFLRERTYITAREWAIARLCADFRTETGVEMTKIGENLPRLVPFMTDTYTPQAVNQARASFEQKVTKAGATFLYGAMSGFFTAEELDETMYEVTEIAKFLLEVEGVDLSVEEELEAEDEISRVMREVREASAEVRGEEVKCPECGHVHETE
ncbi:MAG: DUF5806 family protein [Halolamina sp.]